MHSFKKMSHNTAVLIFAVVCLTFAVKLSVAAYAGAVGSEPCPIRYKCSNIEEVVWATDGNSCFIFRNDCQLKSENCSRQNRYVEVLKTLPKEECQKSCRPYCTMDYRPVCAEYNNVLKTFSNPCVYESHKCTTGETYSLYTEGECGSVQ